MASRMLVVDSGGTTRAVSRFPVVDSGGTTRTIRRGFIIDSGGTARLFFLYLTATLENDGYTRSASPASFRVSSDGNIYAPIGASDLQLQYAWLVAGSASEFEVRVDATSGSFSSGTTGAWQSCATDRTWTRQSGAGTFQSVTFTIQIRRASDASVAASATVGLTCDRT